MKILFLTKRFSPDIGGVEKHVLEVSKVLVDEGHDVTVITESAGPKTIDRVNVLRMPSFPEGKMKKFHIWWWTLQHSYLFITAKVIHVHDVFFWILPIRILFAWKPIFVTFHGYETSYPIDTKAIALRKAYEFLAWGNICVGKYLEKWCHTRANLITYGGIETHTKIVPFIAPQKKLKITFVGRLEKDNDLRIYLEALDTLKKKKTPFSFTAIGDGSLREDIKRYGTVTGFVSDVGKYIENTDILFASSYLSILDGFSMKKHVIGVYTNPLKRDYLRMTPFVNDMTITDDVNVIIETLLKYYRNSNAFTEYIDNAYAFAKENSWEEVGLLYHRLWKK